MADDHYAVLGVEKTSTLAEIRSAYHQLALKHHPDRNKGSKESEEIFRGISRAYNVLSDDRMRKQYDHERARPAPRPTFGGSYTQPAAPGEEAWSYNQGRKYEAVKNSYFYKESERRRAQNEQRTPNYGPNPVFGFTFEEMAGMGIQAPIELGVPVKVILRNVPGLGENVKIVEGPFGSLPGFSIFRKQI